MAYCSAPLRVAVTIVRPGPDSVVDERTARARRVDEHDLLGRQLLEQRVEVGGRHVRPRQVELRGRAVVAAVADQHDEHHVLGRGLLRRMPSNALVNLLAGRAAR